jgi:hypothetical protein
MADFKKNITNISKGERDKYFHFQMPKELDKYVDKKDKVDKSIHGQKKRLEEQLERRKKYVELLEQYKISMQDYDKNPVPILKTALEVAKNKIELHNIEIEITAQQNIFVDTYIYYKEDFMKRYNNNLEEKKSVFKK